MGLLEDKKLADLEQKIEKLRQPRNDFFMKVKAEVLQHQKTKFHDFLKEHGFQVSEDQHRQAIEGNYQGTIKIKLSYPKLEDSFFGADSVFDLSYFKNASNKPVRTCKVGMNINRTSTPSFGGVFIGGTMDAKKMEFYEQTLIPFLENVGTADITGDYTLTILEPVAPMSGKYTDFSDLLNDFVS
ncbi:hypothetical protein AL536_13590 [Vibrio fluvialis]|uniref:Uncharacterized protein n=1 Tax=Vibrio fluvialis TaxID=676 RepID=A0AAX2LN53_VIBFL|nr:hypothetical protein [Vibrio fluvialis]AMF94498.1 hypothetical protein AL536_13590 [Vibrio fluvialis]EKO4008305.1 hypothetical protein [Vibrio fluvialis]MBY8227446.1 hypothetical protein [Vibrio fluvialis]MCE7633008.1 hypothetical protein [Vibrio fluvialis]SUP24451.1 Uncharacterised protein [Vibrio fluvialis]